MSKCENCGREFPGVYPLYCGCGHVTGATAELRFELLGKNLWREWHERLAAAILSGVWDPVEQRRWHSEDWTPRIPSHECDCKQNWRELLKRHPIDWTSAQSAFESSWFLHNEVSRWHSKRPPITLDQAKFLYLGAEPTRTRCIVTVATGQKYHEILNVSRTSLMRYAAKCNADYYEITDAKFSDWKLEKFRVHEFAVKYARTLFLDADLWIRESCPSLFDVVDVAYVAMHDDYSFQQSTGWLSNDRRLVLRSQNTVGNAEFPHCYNSGVVLCSRVTSDIWFPPKQPLPNRHIAEQLWVEHQASKHLIFNLPTAFNCQWWMRDFAALQRQSHIVHLADCPTKLATLRELAAATSH